MNRISDIHLARQEYADDLVKRLGQPLTIIENDNPLVWVFELADGRTVTRTYEPNGSIKTITSHKINK